MTKNQNYGLKLEILRKTVPEVKTKEKSQCMIEETLIIIKDSWEAKVKGDKMLEYWIYFFNDYNVETKRTITIVNVRG